VGDDRRLVAHVRRRRRGPSGSAEDASAGPARATPRGTNQGHPSARASAHRRRTAVSLMAAEGEARTDKRAARRAASNGRRRGSRHRRRSGLARRAPLPRAVPGLVETVLRHPELALRAQPAGPPPAGSLNQPRNRSKRGDKAESATSRPRRRRGSSAGLRRTGGPSRGRAQTGGTSPRAAPETHPAQGGVVRARTSLTSAPGGPSGRSLGSYVCGPSSGIGQNFLGPQPFRSDAPGPRARLDREGGAYVWLRCRKRGSNMQLTEKYDLDAAWIGRKVR
jgi:hypothetical protein